MNQIKYIRFLIIYLILINCGNSEQPPEDNKISGIDTTLVYWTPSISTTAYETYFKPDNAETGDPMPYYNEADQMFYVYFLLGNFSGYSKGGIYLTKTKDFAYFQPVHQEIVTGNNEDIDKHIGTGSCIKNGDTYHYFYTGFNDGPIPSLVTKATTRILSEKWSKIPSFTLSAPIGYEKNEFRDPHVYWDETREKYVMLVGSRKDNRSVIARFQSDDLTEWQEINGLVSTTSSNPQKYEIETDTWIAECPDIFKMGEKWYLIFSRLNRDEHRKTFYRIADNPDGPWRKPHGQNGYHETFDGLYLYAAKTVSDGYNRYISGWASSGQERQSNGELHWGGMLVTHKILQHPSGILFPTIPSSIDNKFSNEIMYKIIKKSGLVLASGRDYTISNGGKVIFNRNPSSIKIEMKIDASKAEKSFGIAFGAYEDQNETYNLTFDTSGNNKYKIPAIFMYHQNKELNFTPLVVPVNKQFDIKIIIERQVCVMYVNNNIAFTNHISNMEKNPWMVFSDDGTVKFSEIKIFKQ